MAEIKQIQLLGRVFLTFDIEAVTGLHIGGTETNIEIGGVDKTIIRDPLSNRPMIPGSSLKGKMRSLLEKYKGLMQNQRIGQGFIHSCGADKNHNAAAEYKNCDVCQVFGVPGERGFSTPTRLIVRDMILCDESASKLTESGRTDLPYTEVKTEVSIDRVTSAANPRQMERVPAGAVFSGGEMVFSIYRGDDADPKRDIQRLSTVVEGLVLLEDDYLGGLGSRGSGKVIFRNLRVLARGKEALAERQLLESFDTLKGLSEALQTLQARLAKELL